MPQVKLILPITRQEIRKVRVAAYCRVSSNSADQQNSYANQIRVYTSLIHGKKEWELVEIFADEGLSGMNAQNRTEFQRKLSAHPPPQKAKRAVGGSPADQPGN